MDKKKLIEKMSAELRMGGMSSVDARRAAEIAAEQGYRKERYSEWVKDTTYEGRVKDVYRCKSCDHYEAVKKGDKKIKYLRFCPACGAMMLKYGEKPDVES